MAACFSRFPREGSLLLNNLIMTVSAAAILLGTLYPVIIDAWSQGQDKVSVGPPFFNAVFIPLMVPMVFAMAIGPFLAWKRGDLASAMKRLWVAGCLHRCCPGTHLGLDVRYFAAGSDGNLHGSVVCWSALLPNSPAASSWREFRSQTPCAGSPACRAPAGV